MLTLDDKRVYECEKRVYTGKLVLNESVENKNFYSYGIFNNRTYSIKFYDIEKMLMDIYMQEDKKVYILFYSEGVMFEAVGNLYKDKVHGMYEWFIGNMRHKNNKCLGDVLFDNVGKKCAFTIGVI